MGNINVFSGKFCKLVGKLEIRSVYVLIELLMCERLET